MESRSKLYNREDIDDTNRASAGDNNFATGKILKTNVGSSEREVSVTDGIVDNKRDIVATRNFTTRKILKSDIENDRGEVSVIKDIIDNKKNTNDTKDFTPRKNFKSNEKKKELEVSTNNPPNDIWQSNTPSGANTNANLITMETTIANKSWADIMEEAWDDIEYDIDHINHEWW